MEVTKKFQIENLFREQPTGKMNWSEEEYVAYTGALGSSQIREFLDSPNAFRQTVIDREPKKESDAFRYGKAVHAYLLEPEKFESTFMVMPTAEKLGFKDFRTNAAKEKRDQYLAEAAEKKCILIDEDELNDIKIIARNIQRHKRAGELIKYGEPEVTYVFRDPTTGIYLKVRIDFLSFAGKMITEVKTTQSSKRKIFGAEIFKRRYDVQVALQMMGCSIVNKVMPDLNNILPIEKEKKEIATYYFNDGQIERAWNALRAALDGIKKCSETGEWPMRQEDAEEVYEPKTYIDEVVETEEKEAYEHFEGAPV